MCYETNSSVVLTYQRTPFLGMVMTSDCVYNFGQCFVDHVLLHTVVRAAITCSPTPLIISAATLLAPVDLQFLTNLTAT